MHQHRHVIADLIRNPEGKGVTWGNNKTTPTIFPLSLDGRGIKGEGEKDKSTITPIHAYVRKCLFRLPNVAEPSMITPTPSTAISNTQE